MITEHADLDALDPRSDVFFFQAEDGIRDYKVTGVQTCALPIWHTVASTQANNTNGNATLSGGNCNNINWWENGAGSYYYTVRRTASGGTPSSLGIIGTVWPYQNTEYGYTFQDCGGAGDASSPEATNTTGNLTVAGAI